MKLLALDGNSILNRSFYGKMCIRDRFSTAAMWGMTPSTKRLVAFFKMFGPMIIKAVERIAAKNTVSNLAQWGFK